MTIQTPEQTLMRGKKRAYKPAVNIQDIVTTRDISIVFRSVDADLNYWLTYDIFSKHYLDVENLYIKPFSITALDIWRDAIYQIRFREIISMSLGEMTFDYSQQKTNAKEFTLTFKFNFFDVEFLLNKSKVLEIARLPVVIQKI